MYSYFEDTSKYRNWKKNISSEDRITYENIQATIDRTMKNIANFEPDELKVVAKSIIKLRNEQKKIIYKYDFKRFVDEMFSGDEDYCLQDKEKTPEFHVEMYNAYQQHARVCVVCPRGHGKSSTARIYLLHQILYKYCKYVVIIGSNEDMAGQNLRWIRDQFTDNPKLIEIYGNLFNKSKWSETEFITTSKVKVTAKGEGQKIRGMNEKGRPDLIYIDDLEDDEMVATKERRDKVSLWLRQTVLPVKSKHGRIIMTGTILDNDSLLKKVSKNLVKDHIPWKVLFYQAVNVDKDGKEFALWEEMKPLSELKALQEVDPEAFAKEFQNDPRAGLMAVFKPEWYVHYDKEQLDRGTSEVFMNGEPLTLLASTDLAVSAKQGADFSVVMITGMDRKMNLYVLDIARIRTADPDEVMSLIFDTCKAWNCDIVTMEVVAFQNTFVRFFEKAMDDRKQYLSIIELTRPSRTKLQRIKSLVAPIKNGLIRWTMDDSQLEDELNAVTALKTGAHDDIIDALSDAWEQQIEHNEEEDKITVPVNSIQWLIQEGLIPTIEEETESEIFYI